MQLTTTIKFFKHEQPAGGWQRLLQWRRDWNKTHAVHFEEVGGFLLLAAFTENIEAAKKEVAAFAAEHHLVAATDDDIMYEPEDYAQAAFIGIFGAPLPDDATANESEAFPNTPQCPVCGNVDNFADPVTQLVIRTNLLEKADADAYNLENGHLLVGPAFMQVADAIHATGLQLHPINDARTQAPSPKWARLTATQAVYLPCPVHTQVEPPGICAHCGTVLGDVSTPFYVNLAHLTDTDLISRHPNKGGLLHVSNRFYKALERAGVRGLEWGDIFAACDHP